MIVLYHCWHSDVNLKGEIVIKNDVWNRKRAIILSRVKIGKGTLIEAKSVVAQDILNYAIAVSNHAQILRYYFQPETIKRLLS